MRKWILVMLVVGACSSKSTTITTGADASPGDAKPGDGQAGDVSVGTDAGGDTVGTDATGDVAGTDAGPGDAVADSGDAVADSADVASVDSGSSDAAAGATDAGVIDAGEDTAGDAGSSDANSAVQCTGTTGTFPTYSKECGSDGDCAIGEHQLNCCGTKLAIGLSKSAQAAFEADEQVCESQYPGCGCAQFPTQAEDGKTGAIAVHCIDTQCMTYAP